MPSYSPVVVAGGLVFTAGQSPVKQAEDLKDQSLTEQTAMTIANVEAVLETVGATLADVVKVNVYLRDMDSFAEFDAEYRRHFQPPRPARTTVGADPDIGLIEIDVVARTPVR